MIDELRSRDIQVYQTEGESMVFIEVSLMNLILRISNEIKWQVKFVLIEV